jgi:hypothetical protein
LARLLGERRGFFVLREPGIDIDIAQARGHDRGREHEAFWRTMTELACFFLSRTYAPGEQVISKESALTIPLLPLLIELEPEAHFLFFFGALEDFLLQILKSQNRRASCRLDAAKMITEVPEIPPAALPELNDAEAAALVWTANIRQFERAAALLGERARFLRFTTFQGAARESLRELCVFFGRPASDSDLDAVLSSEAMKTHSKATSASKPFNFGEYSERLRQGLDTYAADVSRALVWAKSHFGAPFSQEWNWTSEQ